MNATAHLGDDILNALIDDVATGQEREVVERHTATCDTCRQRLDELRAVKAVLGNLQEVAPPRSFRLTEDQARKPTSIPAAQPSAIIRLLPIVRTLSVAAILAVMVLGGVVALGPSDQSLTNETDNASVSFQMQEPPLSAAPIQPGELVDQGESASAHDSTSNALEDEAREATSSIPGPDEGLTTLEVVTIAIGVLAIGLSLAWMGIAMTIRGNTHR
jgi:anti-sigma factor RsiW